MGVPWGAQQLAILELLVDSQGKKTPSIIVPDNNSENWKTHHKAILDDWTANSEQKSFDASKHPRGGDSHFPSRFSESAGNASGKSSQRLRDRLSAARPANNRAKPTNQAPPSGSRGADNAVVKPTLSTRGEVKAPPQVNSEDRLAVESSSHLSPLHHSLERSTLTHGEYLGTGVNKSFVLTLEGDKKGVFKPKQGEFERTRLGIPARQAFKREVAASRIAETLGMDDLVPATVFRNQKGFGIGSMQNFVSDAVKSRESPQPFDGAKDAARAAAFDYLMGQLDRHKGNWLLKDDKLVLIDNGAALPTDYHEDDFFNLEFWRHAAEKELPMPDLASWKDKWPDVESALRACGIGAPAITKTKERFDALTSGDHRLISDLPSLLDRKQTLGHMALWYNREARDLRKQKAVKEREVEDARRNTRAE